MAKRHFGLVNSLFRADFVSRVFFSRSFSEQKVVVLNLTFGSVGVMCARGDAPKPHAALCLRHGGRQHVIGASIYRCGKDCTITISLSSTLWWFCLHITGWHFSLMAKWVKPRNPSAGATRIPGRESLADETYHSFQMVWWSDSVTPVSGCWNEDEWLSVMNQYNMRLNGESVPRRLTDDSDWN